MLLLVRCSFPPLASGRACAQITSLLLLLFLLLLLSQRAVSTGLLQRLCNFLDTHQTHAHTPPPHHLCSAAGSIPCSAAHRSSRCLGTGERFSLPVRSVYLFSSRSFSHPCGRSAPLSLSLSACGRSSLYNGPCCALSLSLQRIGLAVPPTLWHSLHFLQRWQPGLLALCNGSC